MTKEMFFAAIAMLSADMPLEFQTADGSKFELDEIVTTTNGSGSEMVIYIQQTW